MSVDRRDFLKAAAVGAGLGVTSRGPAPARVPRRGQASDVVVIGAGAFGMWTALNLLRLGSRVTVIDQYGPANSRQTSGGETRGVRSSYGDRPHGLLWGRWAQEAMRRWTNWDAVNRDRLLPRVFFNTGDLILRKDMDPYLEDTRANWDALGTRYEVLTAGEVSRRWPWIRVGDMSVAYYEPDAGVVRARCAIESVARVYEQEGGKVTISRATLGRGNGTTLSDVRLDTGEDVSAAQFVFACGPWFPKLFPALMGKRIRIPLGHTFYFGVPPGDTRFMFPNMPSYGVPGCTGWPALTPDHRGFRVRTGGRPPEDPDYSDRWIDKQYHLRPRQILRDYFPDLAGAPIMETRACHYESSVDRNFIVDKHPDFANVWLSGGGSAEAFKFGPVLGEYIAKRVLGIDDDPDLAEQFRLKEEEFEEEDEG
ncbi:MAG TPA: FAD-dependent oxidoreductase [Gemmatimonadales bacterium]